MLTNIRQQLLDILSIELETQRTLAHARAVAAETINRYFQTAPKDPPNKRPDHVRIAIQFSARYIPILSHACRVNLKPLPAQPETQARSVGNTQRTYKKRPPKKHR